MTDEITIKNDGSVVISPLTGDVVKATASRIIEQKLYSAYMEMDPRIITSRKLESEEDIEVAMGQYLYSYFERDDDVNPGNITINVVEGAGGEAVSISLGYSGTTRSGQTVNISSDLSYSLVSGAFLSADFLPGHLSMAKGNLTTEVSFPVSVTAPATEIELPMQPYYSEDDVLKSMIRVLLPDQTDDEPEDISFTIPVYDGRTKYSVGSYTSIPIRRNKYIISIESLVSPVDYNVIKEYGEFAVIVPEGSSCTITGTVKVVTAVNATTSYILKGAVTNQNVFKLKRYRGKYYATFPRSLQIGSYIIKYEAITEEL